MWYLKMAASSHANVIDLQFATFFRYINIFGDLKTLKVKQREFMVSLPV